jgi:FlaA1/EpsC-like NDP-sugar epimerase
VSILPGDDNPAGQDGWKGFALLLVQRMIDLPRNLRQAFILSLDLVAIPLALAGGAWLRAGEAGIPAFTLNLWLAALITVVGSAVVFLRLGLYRAVVRFMGHQAVVAIVKGVCLSTLLLAASSLMTGAPLHISQLVAYWAFMLVFVGATRLAVRVWYRSVHPVSGQPVAIYGAGSAGRQLLNALRHGYQYEPVVFIDDNPQLQGRVISDVPVASAAALPGLVRHHAISEVFLAMASLGSARRREILRSLADHPVRVRSIPPIEDLMGGRASIGQTRQVSLEDLLGRDPVPPRPELLGLCISGKTVLVTGAGGSIGSELCRQILACRPATLLLLDSSEHALYEIAKELGTRVAPPGSETRIVPVLASIQDEARMRRILGVFRIHTIYHAAASKHVPLVEQNVVEGVRNNVIGTLNVALAASRSGVETFVLVSTDKAVRPASTMGASKRLAEMVTQSLAATVPGPRFVIVRFGNVIGSSGSVIPLFEEQIARRGPVTVTHADAERYFMTIPEAAQLLLQAGAMGSGGDVFVLDMGQPIRILDLARRMIHLSGLEVRDAGNPSGDIEIRFTGLRPGEKLREELLGNGEITPTDHPMILRAMEEVPPWAELRPAMDALAEACADYDAARINELLRRLIPGFTPPPAGADPLA